MYLGRMFQSHRDIIDAWPTLQDYAADVGVKFNTARGMRQRSSIHMRYWDEVIAAAKRRRIRGINQNVLRQLALVPRGQHIPTSALHVA
jgi:hypothetical protein